MRREKSRFHEFRTRKRYFVLELRANCVRSWRLKSSNFWSKVAVAPWNLNKIQSSTNGRNLLDSSWYTRDVLHFSRSPVSVGHRTFFSTSNHPAHHPLIAPLTSCLRHWFVVINLSTSMQEERCSHCLLVSLILMMIQFVTIPFPYLLTPVLPPHQLTCSGIIWFAASICLKILATKPTNISIIFNKIALSNAYVSKFRFYAATKLLPFNDSLEIWK